MTKLNANQWTRREVLRSISAFGVVAAAGVPAFSAKGKSAAGNADPLQWVNPVIGTGGHGHTYPGATVPFGMVQLSPDTYNDEWDWCSGYHRSDNSIMGFSHTHLSGTGCGDLLDFLVMPRTGEVRLEAGDRKAPGTGYRSRFSHASEKMSPGYYSVVLDDTKIRAELTATERTGFHRYTFPASKSSHILLDLTHAYGKFPKDIRWCSAQASGNDTILAGHATRAWAHGRKMYIAMHFSKPFEKLEFYLDGKLVEAPTGEVRGKDLKVVAHFATSANEKILIKAGISGVSTDGAKANLEAECKDWNFDRVRREAVASWRKELSRIQIETADVNHKTIFYTGLYHTMLAPTLFDDVDGSYQGMDGKPHKLEAGHHNYTTFSLWDTYRAEHPLFTMIQRERVPDMANSLVNMAVQSPKGVPVWPLQGFETNCMTGYHSTSVIAEAVEKGIQGIDYKTAFAAFKKRAMEDNFRGLPYYRTKGYIPADLEGESVSKTLEYDYDDWAVAHLADRCGEPELAKLLRKRSRNYRNYWDASTRFLRPKMDDGSWASPFNPLEMGHSKKWRDYTESNAWQTLFGVQHDVNGSIEMMGGDKAFVSRLDELFDQSSALPADAPSDISGLIGQYAHGNEPSHHIAYLYTYAGAPEKTQRRVHQINTTLYMNGPDGMSGNEDCGQMSAWFILSSIGFYSVDPVSTNYVFGSPLFDRVAIELGEGKKLVFRTKKQDAKSIYIQKIEFNGKPHSRGWFSYAEIAQGGEFVITLGPKPSATFGKSAEDRPVSALRVEA